MLKKFRTNIDIIDKKLLELLNRRANIAKQVADYKKSSNNKIIFRPDRESQIIKTLRALNRGPLNSEHIHNIYREIISSCLSLETNLNVSFLGPVGTYSEIAMTKFFGSSIEKFANAHPSLRFIMPFIRTPTNLWRNFETHLPGLGLLSKRMKALADSGPQGRADVMGRQVLGIALRIQKNMLMLI